MESTERDAQDVMEPLSDSFLAQASPIALFAALAPWLSTPQAGLDNADQEEALRFQHKAQKVFITQFMWPQRNSTDVKTLSLDSVVPPLAGRSAEGLTLLALSFGVTAKNAESDQAIQTADGDEKPREMEEDMTPRETAATLASVPDRIGPQAPKLLQAQ